MEYVSYTDGKIPSVKLLNLVVRFSIILLHWFPSLSLVDHMAVFICFWFTYSLHFQSGWQKKKQFFRQLHCSVRTFLQSKLLLLLHYAPNHLLGDEKLQTWSIYSWHTAGFDVSALPYSSVDVSAWVWPLGSLHLLSTLLHFSLLRFKIYLLHFSLLRFKIYCFCQVGHDRLLLWFPANNHKPQIFFHCSWWGFYMSSSSVISLYSPKLSPVRSFKRCTIHDVFCYIFCASGHTAATVCGIWLRICSDERRRVPTYSKWCAVEEKEISF